MMIPAEWKSTGMPYGETCKMLLASLDVFRHATPAVSGHRTQQHTWVPFSPVLP